MNQTWRNRKNAVQTIDFSTLTFGKLHPTDLDAVYEYHGQGVLYMEAKCRDVQVGLGQRLLLERLVQRGVACHKLDRALIVDHYVYDADDDIDLGSCVIRSVYDGHDWTNIKSQEITVREYLIAWMQDCDRRAG